MITTQYLTNRTKTTIKTAAGLPVNVTYNPTGKPSPMVVDGGDTSANVDLDNDLPIYDCNVYVYPIDTILLPTGALAALNALLTPAPAPAPSKAAAISG